MNTTHMNATQPQPAYVCHSQCTNPQLEGAKMVKELHDKIEIVAYQALAEKVKELGITGDTITRQQSDEILLYVKQQAHKELYRPDGYWASRLKLLDADGSQIALLIKEQFQQQVNGLGRLVHDRDTKLTNAQYCSLTDMVMAMDDHNYMVKENLLRSWFRCPNRAHAPGREILEDAKASANFYSTLDGQLKFNIRSAVKARQAFFDQHFPGLREPEKGKEFMKVVNVRDFFGGNKVQYDSKSRVLVVSTCTKKYQIDLRNPNAKLADLLSNEDADALFEDQERTHGIKACRYMQKALLENKEITVGEFMRTYFPEIDTTAEESSHQEEERLQSTQHSSISHRVFRSFGIVVVGATCAFALYQAHQMLHQK